MATSLSTAKGARGLQNVYGEGGSSGPRAAYDDNTPAGVDPEGLWRMSNSDRFRRHGTTQAERAGAMPGYTPGYGRSSNRNATGGAGSRTPQAQWDDIFKPRLGPQMDQQAPTPIPNGPTMPGTSPSIPLLPPAATPTPIPPSPGTMDQHPIQQANGTQTSTRTVMGLPPGQAANASFVPGQNSPANLAIRDMRNVPNTQVQQAAKGGKKVSDLPTSFKSSDPLTA